eukprot:7995456-Pyramimonas_sp.AAC.1
MRGAAQERCKLTEGGVHSFFRGWIGLQFLSKSLNNALQVLLVVRCALLQVLLVVRCALLQVML